jgi:hypothetical protein
VTETTPFEDRLRAELDHIRAEVRAERPVPELLLTRARRAMAATLAGAVLAGALVVGASVIAWRGFATDGSVPVVPGPAATSPSAPVGAPATTAEELLSRPLALPSISAGASCPVTSTTTISPGPATGFTGSFPAQQAGVAYLAMSGRNVPLSPDDRTADGWFAIKDVWVIAGSYRGPVLIRGGRIDGAGSVELAWNPTTEQVGSLVIDPGSPSLQTDPQTGWRSVPMEAFVRSPGCYAYQIDGTGFTSFIVFEASR